MGGPCKDCQNRHMGCHSECEAYNQFVKDNEKVKQARSDYLRSYKQFNELHRGFTRECKRKHKKFL